MGANFSLSFYRGKISDFKDFAAHVTMKRGDKTTFCIWQHKKVKTLFAWTINRAEDVVWTGTVAQMGFIHKKTFVLTPGATKKKSRRLTERDYQGYYGQDSGR